MRGGKGKIKKKKKKKGGTMGRDVKSHSLCGYGWLKEDRDVTQGPSKRAGVVNTKQQ